MSAWIFTFVLLNVVSSIFNGKELHTGGYLFVVGLRDKSDPATNFCSGSLVTSRIVLTAGHCIINYQVQDLSVIRHSDEGTSESSVVSLFTHPKFYATHQIMVNDVGMLILQEGIGKSNDAFPEIDGDNLASKTGLGLIIAGWGAITDGGPSPSTLQSADIQVLDFFKCQKKLGKLNQLSRNVSFCAGDPYGLHDACQGDSGGPALATIPYRNRTRLVQVGIISLGDTCGLSNTAAIYTRVSQYKEWIDSIIQPHPQR